MISVTVNEDGKMVRTIHSVRTHGHDGDWCEYEIVCDGQRTGKTISHHDDDGPLALAIEMLIREIKSKGSDDNGK